MSVGAVGAIARSEWRRGWRALVLLGVCVGLAGGVLVGGAALARRTASAPDRLLAEVNPGDAHLQIFGPGLVEEVTALPQVAAAFTGGLAVGRLEGPYVVYNGLVVPMAPPAGVLRPVVIEGRSADPADPDEVVVLEDAAEALGFTPGSELVLTLLTPEEVSQFDTGFGDPDGQRLELQVVGIVRLPPGVLASSPLVGTPALAARIADDIAGVDAYVALHPGARGEGFDDAVRAVAAEVEMPPGAEEFPPVAIDDPAAGTAQGRRSARVLVVGLTAAVAVGAAAGLVVLWQAFSRHHAGTAAAQRVESALGLTAGERTAARLLPALVTVVVAGLVATGVAVAAARLEPPGAVARVEPSPGWRLDVPAVAAGVALLAVVVLLVAAATARRAGRRGAGAAAPSSVPVWSVAPRRRGWPLAGVAFALSTGDRRGRVPIRASLLGAVLGVAGVVATMAFGASLDRLVDTPERYGWRADLVVADVTDEITAELRADERVASVTTTGSAEVMVEGAGVQAYAVDGGPEEVAWELLSGRRPAGPDEVVLGSRLARDLGLAVGDEVAVGTGGGASLSIVGVGVGPAVAGEDLGRAILLDPTGMAALAEVALFREALVVAAAGADAEALAADLAARYEVGARELPRAVRDLADLGSLPEVLGGFVAVLAVAALAHALVVTTRRRRRDLAVLHALGSTPREVGLSIVAMAGATAAVGVAAGVPLGWLLARLAWTEVAGSTGVAGDLLVPSGVAVAVVGAVVLAVVCALPSAVGAARDHPAEALRAE